MARLSCASVSSSRTSGLRPSWYFRKSARTWSLSRSRRARRRIDIGLVLAAFEEPEFGYARSGVVSGLDFVDEALHEKHPEAALVDRRAAVGHRPVLRPGRRLHPRRDEDLDRAGPQDERRRERLRRVRPRDDQRRAGL